MQASGEKPPGTHSNRSTASMIDSAVCSAKNRPVASGPGTPTTVSCSPPSASAITGVPSAWASTAVMPKSSMPANMKARAPASRLRTSSLERKPSISTFGPQDAATFFMSGPAPTIFSLRPGICEKARASSSIRL